MVVEHQINCVGGVDVIILIGVLISIVCFLPLFKGGPGRKGRCRNWREVGPEVQDIAFEGFSFGGVAILHNED